VTSSADVEAAGPLRLTAVHRRTLRGLVGDWPKTTRPLPWCLAGFMTMLFLIPFDSVDLPLNLPLEAKLDRPFLILIVVVWILSLVMMGGRKRLQMTAIHYAWFGFAVIAMLSLVHNADTTVRLGEFELGVRKLALLFSYIALFVVVASGIRSSEVRPLMTFMCGLAVITGIAVIWEYRFEYNVFFEGIGQIIPVNIPPELHGFDSIGRRSVIGPTIHPLAPAMMMACCLPFALISLFESKERRAKILWGLAATIMVAAALATQRKTSIVAPVAAMLVLIAYRPRILRTLAVGAVVLFALVHVLAPGALGSVTSQLLPQNLLGFNSTVDRQSDYAAIEPDVLNQPFLGRGYETYDQKKYRILDNQYLTTIIGTGVIGLLAYISIFAATFLLAHRVARDRESDRSGPAVAIAATAVAMAVGGALFDILAFPQLPYMICFLAGFAAVLWREEYAQRLARRIPGLQPAPAAGRGSSGGHRPLNGGEPLAADR
jgi:O-antigen ligase